MMSAAAAPSCYPPTSTTQRRGRAARRRGSVVRANAAATGASAQSSSTATARASQRAAFDDAVKRNHNVVPVYRRIFDDQLTPILAYRLLVKEDEREAPSFLLESVVGGTQIGRFSFLGRRPVMEVTAKDYEVTTTITDGGLR